MATPKKKNLKELKLEPNIKLPNGQDFELPLLIEEKVKEHEIPGIPYKSLQSNVVDL